MRGIGSLILAMESWDENGDLAVMIWRLIVVADDIDDSNDAIRHLERNV